MQPNQKGHIALFWKLNYQNSKAWFRKDCPLQVAAFFCEARDPQAPGDNMVAAGNWAVALMALVASPSADECAALLSTIFPPPQILFGIQVLARWHAQAFLTLSSQAKPMGEIDSQRIGWLLQCSGGIVLLDVCIQSHAWETVGTLLELAAGQGIVYSPLQLVGVLELLDQGLLACGNNVCCIKQGIAMKSGEWKEHSTEFKIKTTQCFFLFSLIS